MNNTVSNIIFAVMAVMGGGSSLYILVSFPAVIVWKIYRHLRYGYKLTD